MLPESTAPIDAAREVQSRPADSRYHDIVVSYADGSFGTISVADLFAEVAHTHAYVGRLAATMGSSACCSSISTTSSRSTTSSVTRPAMSHS